MDFYTIVTICAILLLIIALTTLGVVISYSTSTQEFPKFKNPCPDYWRLDGNNNKCISNGINNGVLDTTSTSAKFRSSREGNNNRKSRDNNINVTSSPLHY